MEYNTARNLISIREYGRHIQRMVEYIITIEDREKRNRQAKLVIELMGFLNPHLKIVEDFRHMLWDHLFFISDFKLDVDSPYPIPERATYKAKPEPMPYPNHKPKFAHLGKNLELMMNKAIDETDPETKEAMTNTVAYYMKICYTNWHKEDVQDESIKTELSIISKGKLEVGDGLSNKKMPVDTLTRPTVGPGKKYFNNRPGSGPSRGNGPSKQNGPSRGGNSRDGRSRDPRDKNNNRNNFKKRY